MVVSGAAGTLADLAYGWSTACRPHVLAWQRHEQQQKSAGHPQEPVNKR
jgi:hypothetical protein